MTKRRVGVLMGGMSAEREVSLRTGDGVAAALESKGHDVVRIVFGPTTPGIDEMVREAQIDVAFLALHGRGGEDGCVQGLLELLGVPYTGSNVLASALAMDKLKAKEMFRLHNVPTPPYYAATRRDLDGLEEMHGSFGFPCIVKPRGEGSSVGLTKCADLGELALGIDRALEYDACALVERFVRGMEVPSVSSTGACSARWRSRPRAASTTTTRSTRRGATEYILPPRLPATRTRKS